MDGTGCSAGVCRIRKGQRQARQSLTVQLPGISGYTEHTVQAVMWVPGRGGPCSALPGVSRSSFSLYRKGATPGQCKGTNTKCTELVLGNMFAKLAVAVAFSNSCWLNLMPTPKGSSERAEKQPRLSYAGSLGWPSQPTNACGRRSAFHMDPGRRLCQGIRPNSENQ